MGADGDFGYRSGTPGLQVKSRALLLFGATGDLARRMLLPSLFSLHRDNLLPADFEILATARSSLDDDAFRLCADTAIRAAIPAERLEEDAVRAFMRKLKYVRADVSDAASCVGLAAALGVEQRQNLAIFLSTAPQLFEQTISNLQHTGLGCERTRVGLEKPLGTDLESSRLINDAVMRVFAEENIFRIDHYLGKETVQNLLALRFGNSLFEPLWNASGIDHIQITIAETVGLEGRNAYFDQSGVLRDMVQNHMLQLLALIAMEPPTHFNATAIRDEKVKVLRSLRPLDRDSVLRDSVIGQYGPGAIGTETVSGYADELGTGSGTETFVALKVHIDNWRWRGVPFYLRTGKRMPARKSEIFVQFKPVPHSIFEDRGSTLSANKLVLGLQPEEYVRLLVMTKEPGLDRDGILLRELPLDLSLTTAFSGRRRIAYERLLLDLIEGDSTLFVRRDEVEAQWRWIDAIRVGWSRMGMVPEQYAAGSWGPSASLALAARDDVYWHE
jgi:glucose-6-phosphate 1-dehydrogenase